MTRYAEKTQVDVNRSLAEIERILRRFGAARFMYGWENNEAVIGFEVRGRRIRFVLPLPAKDDADVGQTNSGRQRSGAVLQKALEQAERQRWRALVLAIKAKLEVVESGIATFEDEFLAYTVLPDGNTVGRWAEPQIEAMYGKALPAPKDEVG